MFPSLHLCQYPSPSDPHFSPHVYQQVFNCSLSLCPTLNQSIPIQPCLSGASHCCGDNFHNLYLDLQILQNLAPTHSLALFLSNLTIHIHHPFPPFSRSFNVLFSFLPSGFPSFSILFPKLWHTRLNNHLLTKVHFALHLGQVKHVYHHISVCCIMITILINCLSAYYPCLPCSTCPSLPKHSIYINFVRQGPWRSCSLVDLQL